MKLLACLLTVCCLFACVSLFKLPGSDTFFDGWGKLKNSTEDYFSGRSASNATKSDKKSDKKSDNGTVTDQQVCYGVLGEALKSIKSIN